MGSNKGNILQIQIPKLNGNNYHHWSIQMKVLFESEDLWNIVEDGVQEPTQNMELTNQQENKLKESIRSDKKALLLIYQTVEEVIFERISFATSSKSAWDMLYKAYRGEEKVKMVKLQTLRCEFDNLRMKEEETIEEFYNRVIILMNQLRLNGENMEEKRVVEKILRSLTRKFEYIVVAIEESKDISVLSLEGLLGSLQSHELRMRQFVTSSCEQVFQLQSTNKEDTCDKSNGSDHEQSRDKRRGKSYLHIQCYHCRKYGHTSKVCRKRIKEKKGSRSLT